MSLLTGVTGATLLVGVTALVLGAIFHLAGWHDAGGGAVDLAILTAVLGSVLLRVRAARPRRSSPGVERPAPPRPGSREERPEPAPEAGSGGASRGLRWLAGGLAAAAVLAAAVAARSWLAGFVLGQVVSLSILTLEAWLAALLWRPYLGFWMTAYVDLRARYGEALTLAQLIECLKEIATGLLLAACLGVLTFFLLLPRTTPLPIDRTLWTALVPPLCLLPVATGLALRGWPRLDRSRHLFVRAAADVVLSLLLGLDVVLVLLVGANFFALSPAAVRAVRGSLERLGPATEVPQFLWIALYAVLALAGIAAALGPKVWRRPWRWVTRARLVPSLTIGKRALTVVHLTLLVSTLVGIAGPPALEPAVRGQLRARYALALRDQLDSEATLSAYRAIRAAAPALPAGQRPTLAAALLNVRTVAHSQASGHRTADVEADLAWRLGSLQSLIASSRGPLMPVQPLSTPAAQAALRRMDAPVRGSPDLESRLDEVADRQEEGTRAHEALHEAAELAAGAVASALFLPGAADHELLQIVQEYLSGVIEGSPLKNLLVQAAERRWFREPAAEEPPDAARLLVIQIGIMRTLAIIRESDLRRFADLPAADVLDLERKEAGWAADPAELAVVEFVNETRVLEQSPSCLFCGYSGKPGSAEGERASEAHESGRAGRGARPVEIPVRPAEP